MGVTGSLTLSSTEATFFAIDALNSKAKVVSGKNTNTIHILKEAIKKEGPLSLFRGLETAFLGASAYGFMFFSIYHLLKDRYRDQMKDDKAKLFIASSLVTQGISLSLFYPFDMVKVRFQTAHNSYKYKNTFDAFR